MPALGLEPGEHALTGRFVWSAHPQTLPVPSAKAMVALRLNLPAPGSTAGPCWTCSWCWSSRWRWAGWGWGWGALALEAPLLPGERVLREGAQIRDGRLLVSLAPGVSETGWDSSLEPVDSIRLRASEDDRLSEAWRVEANPLWHLTWEGIPVVRAAGGPDRWLPTWRPWQGEEGRLLLSRPAGVVSPTLTLVPATKRVEIAWRQPNPPTTFYQPAVPNVGLPGVNARVQVAMAPDRWILSPAAPPWVPPCSSGAWWWCWC